MHGFVEGGERHSRDIRIIGGTDGESVDIEAAASEESGDPGQRLQAHPRPRLENVLAATELTGNSKAQALTSSGIRPPSAHHVPGGRTGGRHRKQYAGVDWDIEKDRAIGLTRSPSILLEVCGILAAHPGRAEGLLPVSPSRDWDPSQPSYSGDPKTTPALADHAHVAVVHQKYLDRDLSVTQVASS